MQTPRGALNFARKAHDGQTDRGGFPYIGHIERVVANAQQLLDRIPDARLSYQDRENILQAAALHDTTEDTSVTRADLAAAWFNPAVLDMVDRLDGRPPGVSYQDNIIAMAAEGNIGVIVVKPADNLDNGDPARIAQLPPEQRSIERRYARARAVLEAAYNAFLEDA